MHCGHCICNATVGGTAHMQCASQCNAIHRDYWAPLTCNALRPFTIHSKCQWAPLTCNGMHSNYSKEMYYITTSVKNSQLKCSPHQHHNPPAWLDAWLLQMQYNLCSRTLPRLECSATTAQELECTSTTVKNSCITIGMLNPPPVHWNESSPPPSSSSSSSSSS